MNMKKKDPESTEMTFFEHIDALRPHLVRGVMAIGVIGLVAFFCKSFIIDTVLFGATKPGLPHQPHADMGGRPVGAYGRMAQQRARHVVRHRSGDLPHRQRPFLDHQHFAVRAVQPPHEDLAPDGTGNGHALHAVGVLALRAPALTPKEIQGTHLFVFWVSLCFFGGLLFGYFVMAPLSINFFANYQASEFITNMFDISDYLTTVIIVSIACAFMFELPLLIYFLTRMGLVSAGFLRKYRRHAFVILLVVAAIITPPDIFSLILVILPLYGQYELSIKLAERTERKHAAEEEQTTEMTETTE